MATRRVRLLTAMLAVFLAVPALLGLTVAGPAASGALAQGGTPASPVAGQPLTSVADLVARVEPAVVTVLNLQQQQGPFGGSDGTTQPAGTGTGFIIDDQGHIITNQHVVNGGDEFSVTFYDGTEAPATLIGADPRSDLAVVKVDGPLPGIVSLADSSRARPGDPVVAIGSPLGAFTNTVTQGIISATERDFPGQPQQGEAIYSNLIQHDAAINPGNSGGPLFNLAGEVVGVNTLGIPAQNGQPVQGLFFAIPSNTVARITQQLIEQGRVVYPYFGISILPITPDVVAQYDLPVDHGAGVVEVGSGTPADEAGIQVNDIILEIAGQRIDAQNSFSEVLFTHQPGETVDVLVQRGDEQITVQVTLEEAPE